jgi:small-conductance mechanosensitive channel
MIRHLHVVLLSIPEILHKIQRINIEQSASSPIDFVINFQHPPMNSLIAVYEDSKGINKLFFRIDIAYSNRQHKRTFTTEVLANGLQELITT